MALETESAWFQSFAFHKCNLYRYTTAATKSLGGGRIEDVLGRDEGGGGGGGGGAFTK
jgi:hypothetical protein